jgi:hypothetical protein
MSNQPNPNPIMRYFAFDHLSEGPLKATSAMVFEASVPNGPEKSAGLRKLLEAKDCFVRAALDLPKDGA